MHQQSFVSATNFFLGEGEWGLGGLGNCQLRPWVATTLVGQSMIIKIKRINIKKL